MRRALLLAVVLSAVAAAVPLYAVDKLVAIGDSITAGSTYPVPCGICPVFFDCTAACDDRISVAVPCCAYNNYMSFEGTLRHCPCNAIPGIFRFGEYWDVAGLIAPRALLTVNGSGDSLHPVAEVDAAVSRLREIYMAAGAAQMYEHRYGEGGHRFYSDLMWPWIESNIGDA